MNSYFQDLVNSTLELVAYDSVQATPCKESPFGMGVAQSLEKILDIAKSFGFKTHNESGYYGTAVLGEGEEFGILGHVDVVPYNKAEWHYKPLGEVRNGILYGRGVLDDKGPILACLFAVKELLDKGYKPTKKIKFIFGGNEETGWKCIDRYNELETMPYTGISPDADFPVINCEKGIVHIIAHLPIPSGLLSAKGGERPNMVIASCEAEYDGVLDKPLDINVSTKIENGHTFIKALGIAAHGSTPEKGDNAFLHLLKYLAETAKGEYIELYNILKDIDGAGFELKISDEKSGNLTCNIGVVDLINQRLHLTIDFRHPICISPEEIIEKVSKTLNCKCEILHKQDPLYVDKNDPLVQKLLSAYEKVTNEKVEPITIGGGTYARALNHGVGFGPVFPNEESTAHEADEHISLESFEKAYNVYVEAIKQLCFE